MPAWTHTYKQNMIIYFRSSNKVQTCFLVSVILKFKQLSQTGHSFVTSSSSYFIDISVPKLIQKKME